PDMKILIEGFTSGEEDAHIGLERATVVKTYLVNRGITPNNIQIENRGKSMQLIEEINEECRLKNRRIVITNTHRN
ncbi:outer membrane protein OmpA-like peptidoglycan-associated protein, partial [Dysgonomonadaceae bacterium PH5-43]|nr:outer membrane protein OmpA-like peptidoglycan-associated protein [Dysgonomonadaceae bacterium PH5-43]